MSRFVPILLLLVLLHLAGAHNRVDMIRPDAPALAAFGEFTPGVRTLEFTNPDQLDIAAWRPGQELHRYDRPLVAEVWYPASVPPDSEHEHAYTVVTRDGTTTAILLGRAHRDAPPSLSRAPFPLVILSHGYPGNRFALGHLGENLASKGYVVVSIDHTDSTYVDQRALGSSLLNRPLDQLFVLNEMARMTEDEASILEGVVDANRTAIIGFSMGATGALNAVGAGFTEASVDLLTHELVGLLA